MPPRIPLPSPLRLSSLCIRSAPKSNAQLPFTPSATLVTIAQRRKYKDPYALAQARSRKEANMSRRTELQEQRNIAMGDPVRGITTPFLESFDNVGGSTKLVEAKPSENDCHDLGFEMPLADDALLNHFLTAAELKASINHSIALVAPVQAASRDGVDPDHEKVGMEDFVARHKNATIAMARIVSLANASQQDRTRANIMRCIDTFGRHKTDETLRPRFSVNPSILGNAPVAIKTPRAGPDTGSSEVQIAILTAKIRVLANQLEMKGGKKDKVNKRNLRVMVHKRQKHLQYLRKKERGGDRWQHLVNTLGLSEGTWKGEISL